MKNVRTITLSTSIPIIEAASRSYAVACIAFPSFVQLTSRRAHHDEPDQPNVQRTDVQALERVDEVERVVRAEVGSPEQQDGVLDEERDAERADQRRDPRRVPQRPVREPLDHDPQDAAAEHRGDEHQRD
jgi:hypothetical protein